MSENTAPAADEFEVVEAPSAPTPEVDTASIADDTPGSPEPESTASWVPEAGDAPAVPITEADVDALREGTPAEVDGVGPEVSEETFLEDIVDEDPEGSGEPHGGENWGDPEATDQPAEGGDGLEYAAEESVPEIRAQREGEAR